MTVSHLFSNKMAVTMALFWVSLVLTIIGTNAGGEFSVFHSPDSLKFSEKANKLKESSLKELFSAALGLSVEGNPEWNGLSVTDPFSTPEAVVEVYIDGVSSLGQYAVSKATTYPLNVDEYEPDTYEAVSHRIKQRFSNGGNKVVDIEDLSNYATKSSYEDVFGKIHVPGQSQPNFKASEEEDQFLRELEILKEITKKVESGAVSGDNTIDFYYIRFRSLHALSDVHGPNASQTKDAKKLLAKALEDLSNAFVNAYGGSVLVTAVATDVAHTRRVRAAEEAPAASATQETEVDSEDYDENYSAIFNIILWFSIVLIFTLISIVYAIMDMDPGRDSIIYRMTSTRMKKDN